ncbi:MAG: hypothetical protein KME29_12260 [Calothrix sp. FI2-JRJ7]|jgi:hypothetical protein|nr:hypothetical protein [Calothrix sp. FI2-JRJ7]
MESIRSVKGVKAGSKLHSVNPIEGNLPDIASPSEHPLWDMANALSIAADPTKPVNSERVNQIVTYIEKGIKATESPKHESDLQKARAVVLRTLADRMLLLAGACQSDPSQVKAYVDCFEKLITASDNQLRASEMTIRTKTKPKGQYDHWSTEDLIAAGLSR